jgi:hypothetical protein
MKRRETEDHLAVFKQRLADDLKVFEAQGVTMNENFEYTSVLEAFEVEESDAKFWSEIDSKTITQVLEYLDAQGIFTWQNAVMNYRLASGLGTESFIILYTPEEFRVWKYRAGGVTAGALNAEGEKVGYFNEDQFAKWWASKKNTKQNKLLENGGKIRQKKTKIDGILKKHNLMWGGNVDGYILDERGEVLLIIDFISNSSIKTQKSFVDQANPNKWFDNNPTHGPKFEGWAATMGIAEKLEVPHLIAYLPAEGEAEWAVILQTIQLEKRGIKVLSQTGVELDNGFSEEFFQGAAASEKRILDILKNGITPKVNRD